MIFQDFMKQYFHIQINHLKVNCNYILKTGYKSWKGNYMLSKLKSPLTYIFSARVVIFIISSYLMSNKSIAGQSVLCSNKQHPLSHIFFCKNCANSTQDLNSILFCEDCHPEYKNKHMGHLFDKTAFDNNNFITLYTEFKSTLLRATKSDYFFQYKVKKGSDNANDMKSNFSNDIARTTVPFKNCLTSSNKPSKQQFSEQRYREWLVKYKFWNHKSALSLDLKKEIDDFLKWAFEGGSSSSIKSPWDFPITLSSAGKINPNEFQDSMTDLKNTERKLNKQIKLGDLFIHITSCFTNGDIEKGIQDIKKIQNQPNALPYPFLLYLAKLKILQLHTEGSQKMKKVLAEQSLPINDNRQKQLFYYYSAISEWKIVEDESKQVKSVKLFYEPRNKKNYKLVNPKNYIKCLQEAIRFAGDKPNPLYFASKAIGHIVLNQNDEAQYNFQKAKGIRNDAALCNKYFNNLQRKQQLNKTLIKEALSERSTEYILNLSKHLKKIKDYKELKIYYEELTIREPRNLSFRLKKFENFFRLKDKEGTCEELNEIKRLNELSQQQILQCQRKIQLLKARQTQDFNYSDAEGKFEHIASTGRASATHWYNYAAFLFKHRDQREKNERALMAINKALQIKQKPHFYELKYLLLFVSGNLEEAKKLHSSINHAGQKFKLMIEYVNQS